MNKKTLAALKASIQHWRENEAAETIEQASVGADDCALCDVFQNGDCTGCPVANKTGKNWCVDSPWEEARRAYLHWGLESTNARAAFRTAARAEREFLESLLPGGER